MDLSHAVTAARREYERANPASRAAFDTATESMPGGNTRSVLFHPPFPLTMASGAGARLTDVDGHTYVDLLGEFTAGLYGHSHPVIRAAIDRALDGGWNLGAHGTGEAPLAEVLCGRFPSLDLVRFTNSGTEANLLALALATAATGRQKVLVFDGAYHGGVLAFHGGGAPTNAPHDWVVADYNDVTGARLLIARHATDLAAILVEPMLGSGGCIPGDPAFLQALREGATDAGAVLIFDEVMTSRMSGGGMQERLGIGPDLTTLGKYIGGGMSVGAFGGRRDLMERFDPRRPDALAHAGTFNNNVLTMAAGHAGLTQLFTPEVAEDHFTRGEILRHRLNSVSANLPFQWTGLGSLLTAHFQHGPIASAADLRARPDRLELLHLDLLQEGYYLARRGMLALSLAVSDEDVDGFVTAVTRFVERRAGLLS